ncbi:hypothetical protein T11_9648 [Trichinella zimbabwensis]|uniref:Uncharacterized protein n=1 Tax=Trichinella zimbabwensis TaxID=268475 RepID=A0A0V1H8D4_9BILA|nr:hypothetical protein T11_9648 [Trichinella zimbabwensis]
MKLYKRSTDPKKAIWDSLLYLSRVQFAFLSNQRNWRVLLSDHHIQRIGHICTDVFGIACQRHSFSNKLTKLTIQTSWSSWFRCIFQNRPKVLRTVDQYDKFENGDEPHYHKKRCICSIHSNLSKMSNRHHCRFVLQSTYRSGIYHSESSK